MKNYELTQNDNMINNYNPQVLYVLGQLNNYFPFVLDKENKDITKEIYKELIKAIVFNPNIVKTNFRLKLIEKINNKCKKKLAKNKISEIIIGLERLRITTAPVSSIEICNNIQPENLDFINKIVDLYINSRIEPKKGNDQKIDFILDLINSKDHRKTKFLNVKSKGMLECSKLILPFYHDLYVKAHVKELNGDDYDYLIEFNDKNIPHLLGISGENKQEKLLNLEFNDNDNFAKILLKSQMLISFSLFQPSLMLYDAKTSNTRGQSNIHLLSASNFSFDLDFFPCIDCENDTNVKKLAYPKSLYAMCNNVNRKGFNDVEHICSGTRKFITLGYKIKHGKTGRWQSIEFSDEEIKTVLKEFYDLIDDLTILK